MKERPILFSTPMVQAILDGRKIQTRRIVKFKYLPEIGGSYGERVMIYGKSGVLAMFCPYGTIGDILWVRETWSKTDSGRYIYKASNPQFNPVWKPSIFMPKEACRIKLLVKNIRVEKLCDITEENAMAEGISLPNYAEQAIKDVKYPEPSDIYAELWDEINGTGAWIKNPWVWVIEFNRQQ